MKDCQHNEWFRNWFDSPYYHLLYRHRDDEEAGMFLDNLLNVLNLASGSKILDLACGKGRHAIFLHNKGFNVTGIDLSPCSIAEAKKSIEKGLQFEVMDMRHFDLNQKFDCILNLFTSFGYFANFEENRQVLTNIGKHLQPGGHFVLDYFNPECVKGRLHPPQVQVIEGVSFNICKYIEENTVIKEIIIQDESQTFRFEERVQLLQPEQICGMLNDSGLTPISMFGDYELNAFNQDSSERFIIIAKN